MNVPDLEVDGQQIYFGQEFTVAFWFQHEDIGEARAGLVNYTDDFATSGWGIYVEYDSAPGTGRVRAWTQRWDLGPTSQPVPENTWTHVAFTRRGGTNRLYINGQFEASENRNLASTTGGLGFGNGRNQQDSRKLEGKIAEVRYYNHSFRDAEVRALYEPATRWALYTPETIFVPEVVAGVVTGTGALQAQPADVSGSGNVIGIHTGDGTLQAQPATVTGAGDLISAVQGTGTLQAQDAAVVGAGAIVQDGTGALQAQDAAVSGVGEVGNVRTGTGALQAQDATVTGAGDRASVGTGALQAQDAAVSGVGELQGLTTGTGALQAQDATVSGLGEFTFEGTGALQAQAAAVTGVGFNLGEITLTPGDLAAIQQVVWSAPEAQELLSKVNEIWRRRGLDSGNPHTYDKVNNQIRVADIIIDLTGDANEVTQTRRP